MAHHGSSDAGLAAELGILRPRVAIISVGAHNDYGHPRPDTIAALHEQPGLAVYRTDEVGRIVLDTSSRYAFQSDGAAFVRAGIPTLALNADNSSWNGIMRINGGAVLIGNSNALGSNIAANNTVVTGNGAALLLTNTVNVSEQLNLT